MGQGSRKREALAKPPTISRAPPRQAALANLPFSRAKAWSSQGVRASMSVVSTVAPHQILQARRRVPIGSDVVGDLLFLERAGQRLGEGRLALGREGGDGRIDHLQAYARVRSGRRNAGEEIDPRRTLDPCGQRAGICVGPGEQTFRPAQRFRPLQRVDIVLDAQHRRSVDGFAIEKALGQLAALRKSEKLRQRPWRSIGLQPFGRARAEHNHAVRGLSAQRLLPGERHDVEFWPVETLCESRRGGVADRQAFSVRWDPVGVGHADAGRRAVPGKDDVVVEIDTLEVRQFTVGRA